MILADTCIWIDHQRQADDRVLELLAAKKMLAHPFVIGELALGQLRHRKAILQSLQKLPQAELAEPDEVLRFIELHDMHGSGIGYVDAHLLASCRLSDALLFTRDRRLKEVAAKLKLAMR